MGCKYSAGERVYEKGQVYDFYTDIRDITNLAENEVFLIDAPRNCKNSHRQVSCVDQLVRAHTHTKKSIRSSISWTHKASIKRVEILGHGVILRFDRAQSVMGSNVAGPAMESVKSYFP